MNRSIVRALSAAAALLLAVAGAVEAQGVTTGALSGTVSDSMGAPIAGATVEVK
jgi:protocatechuate 3,4-dioxygenase beta subunit